MKYIFVLGLLFSLSSCVNQTQQQNLESLDQKSAREVTLTTATKGDTVYHITKQIIWVNGEKIQEKADTITTNLIENTWASDTNADKPLNQIPIYVTVQ
ncbi:hypothetical protein K5I29_05135 [Flavobacterium agricola]|uniref:Uncharacterized protein n=1 Tax=Flavobacterium agricola TaxID=2870839 RepID=A0ABY6M153_9FLAO|nr:hypothetical protein [Flavobacterium agricola]UYW02287.1 hypothetical protein K5I29_05135 [Flavobacterium agricola]